jgi:hypothetical protein
VERKIAKNIVLKKEPNETSTSESVITNNSSDASISVSDTNISDIPSILIPHDFEQSQSVVSIDAS